MEPNDGTQNPSPFTSVTNAFRAVAPFVALVASAAAFWTQATVKNAVVELRQELQESISKNYESRESALVQRGIIQDRLTQEQRERDDLRSFILRLEERLRYLETRRGDQR